MHTATDNPRALILIRLSRDTDATTSPERQEKDSREYCQRQGYTVVGVVSDIDVSGSTDPLERSGSGPWLRERLNDFDFVVAQKLARFGRTTRHVYGLFQYLADNGKRLFSADGQINTAGPTGELILFILAWAAQMELAEISERNRNAAQYNMAAGKYRGGIVPAGYRKQKLDGKGWTLVHDEVMSPVIQGIVRRILAGETMSSIVADLNAQKVPTARDRQAELNGKPVTGRQWSVSNLGRILGSPTLIGQGTRADESGREVPLLNDDGEIVQRGEPLISTSDYRALKAKLDERAPATRKIAEPSLMLGILSCECGRPMWVLRGGKRLRKDGTVKVMADRYRCASNTQGDRTPCGHPSVKFEDIEPLAHGVITHILGADRPLIVKEWQQGTANGDQLAELEAEIANVADDLPYLRGDQRQQAREMLERLYARLEELQDQEDTPSGWVFRESDVSLGEHWAALDTAGKNQLLRDYGVKIVFGKSGVETHLTDLPALLGSVHESAAKAATLDPAGYREYLRQVVGTTTVERV